MSTGASVHVSFVISCQGSGSMHMALWLWFDSVSSAKQDPFFLPGECVVRTKVMSGGSRGKDNHSLRLTARLMTLTLHACNMQCHGRLY